MPSSDRSVTKSRSAAARKARGSDEATFPTSDPASDEFRIDRQSAELPAQGTLLEEGAPLFLGHRERLRNRFDRGGGDAMPDYELLELVLFRAIRRRDMKDLAKRLIARFGSFAEVINAPAERIKEVKGAGDAVAIELKLMREVALRLQRAEAVQRPVVSSTAQVIEYVRAAQAYESREVFRVLFLDKRNKIIADEVQGKGTVDHTPVYIREVVKRALEINASALILVHNHPSGDPTPSPEDIAMTARIEAAAQALNITLHDHLIIGKSAEISFRAEGLL